MSNTIHINLNFGTAQAALNSGLKVGRKGWNGKGMYIKKVDGYFYKSIGIEPFYLIKNVSGTFNTWVPSISDLQATDWEVME